ncbi:MAG: polysaccharide biosynthesis C-terminal domain-containing protein, partial [Lachnospiraceae bacterium]|nr:polysaccharide biosynthesis C-terminal domain-containing protein [Lachnospiraceae bacterium]
MKEKDSKMKINRKEFYRNLTRLALPIMLQSLMLASVAAGDALMLGKIAQDEMTAVSLATQIQFVQNMFLAAIAAAGAILGAQYWGKGDKRTLEDIFNMILRFCGIVSVIFFLACELMPGQLMRIFTSDAPLIAIGSSYLRIAGWSYLLTGISQCYLTMMKVSDHVKPGALISSCAVILNIVLNAVFIFGLFGAPKMQARGAALATTISRMIELALCVAVSSKPSYIRPVFSRFIKQSKQLKTDFLRQCLPLLGGSLCWGVGFTSYTAIMGHMGTDAAAANSVAAVVRDLFCCMCN